MLLVTMDMETVVGLSVNGCMFAGTRTLLLRFLMKMQSNQMAGWTTSLNTSETPTPSNLKIGELP